MSYKLKDVIEGMMNSKLQQSLRLEISTIQVPAVSSELACGFIQNIGYFFSKIVPMTLISISYVRPSALQQSGFRVPFGILFVLSAIFLNLNFVKIIV